MNWDDPSERAALIERVGITAYNAALEKHFADSTVETVAGHGIRIVRSARWGTIYMVDGTGKGFSTLQAARDFARTQS